MDKLFIIITKEPTNNFDEYKHYTYETKFETKTACLGILQEPDVTIEIIYEVNLLKDKLKKLEMQLIDNSIELVEK